MCYFSVTLTICRQLTRGWIKIILLPSLPMVKASVPYIFHHKFQPYMKIWLPLPLCFCYLAPSRNRLFKAAGGWLFTKKCRIHREISILHIIRVSLRLKAKMKLIMKLLSNQSKNCSFCSTGIAFYTWRHPRLFVGLSDQLVWKVVHATLQSLVRVVSGVQRVR